MAVSKSVIVLLALVAVAAAVEKRQAILAAGYPYPLAKAIIPPAKLDKEDDGSWAVNKYDAVEVPIAAPLAAPYAAPYAAYPYAAAPYAAYPYAAAAYPYAAYPYAYGDDGSYFPGKYGPEYLL